MGHGWSRDTSEFDSTLRATGNWSKPSIHVLCQGTKGTWIDPELDMNQASVALRLRLLVSKGWDTMKSLQIDVKIPPRKAFALGKGLQSS